MEKQKNAVGRRKEAVARVYLSKGTGNITVNDKDYKAYFPIMYLQNQVELQSQIYNVLTADQKAKLPQVLADMKSKAEARRAAWQQQHGAAATGAAGSN